MKRWMVAALVFALALAVVPLAAAANGGFAHGKSKFNLVGTTAAVDADAGTLVVMVKAGTRTVKAFRGAELGLSVDPQAKIRLVTADGCVVATLAEIPVGVKVKVRGRIDRTDPANLVFVATFVKAKGAPAPAPSVEPSPIPSPDPEPAPETSETPTPAS